MFLLPFPLYISVSILLFSLLRPAFAKGGEMDWFDLSLLRTSDGRREKQKLFLSHLYLDFRFFLLPTPSEGRKQKWKRRCPIVPAALSRTNISKKYNATLSSFFLFVKPFVRPCTQFENSIMIGRCPFFCCHIWFFCRLCLKMRGNEGFCQLQRKQTRYRTQRNERKKHNFFGYHPEIFLPFLFSFSLSSKALP